MVSLDAKFTKKHIFNNNFLKNSLLLLIFSCFDKPDRLMIIFLETGGWARLLAFLLLIRLFATWCGHDGFFLKKIERKVKKDWV